jgi:lycopene beta-cyclase
LVEHDYTVVDGAALGHAVDAALAGVSGSRLVAEVTDIVAPTEGRLLVRTHDSEIPADLVFDSVGVGLGRDPRAPTAWMSFTGWRVRVDRPGFVADAVMLMDFRVPQHDQVRFVYVLPDDACLALVELTVISADGSPPDGATGDLTAYLDRELGAGRWHADSGEQGAIPLSPSGRRRDLADGLVTIGSAAGLVKASTGYGYRLMERDAELLARAYPVVNRRRHGLRRRARHRAMDAVFLHLAVTEPMLLVAALEGMFAANPIDRVVRFLNEESSLGDELHVVRSLPRRLFLRAAGQLVVSALPGRRTG